MIMIVKAVNLALLFLLPFFFAGLINRVKSRLSGRMGPPILQPVKDFVKLMKKSEVISVSTSLVFIIAPSITLGSVIVAGLLVPMSGGSSILSFDADFILFAYLLGLGKFFSIISAMDTGSSFEGMGASREGTFAGLVEPPFFITIASLGLLGGGISFSGLMKIPFGTGDLTGLVFLMGVVALFIMVIVEGCRVPVDDPNTHLELTMIHEVMILDNSGPGLGYLTYSSWMKMVVMGSIIANLIIPEELYYAWSLLLFLAVIALLAMVIGIIETVMARLRMTHIPQFLFFMTSISIVVLSTIVLFISGGLK